MALKRLLPSLESLMRVSYEFVEYGSTIVYHVYFFLLELLLILLNMRDCFP